MAIDFKKLALAQAQGKAFGPNPSFEDPGRTVGFVDLNEGRVAGQSPSRSIGGKRVTQKHAARHLQTFGGIDSIDWVMDCLRYWADTVSNAEYHFEKPKSLTPENQPGDPVAPPPALDKLLKSPNPYMDYIEMMELLVMDLLLVGNAYWLKWKDNGSNQPAALYRLAPPYVEIATNPWGPAAYVYQIPNADKIVIQPEEVMHLKLANPDPANPFYGMGLIQGAGRAADIETAVTHTQAGYYENRTMPSLTVETDRRVPKDVFRKMRAQLRARAQGPRNAGELLVLEAGLKMNSIAPNAVDAGFEKIGKMSRDRVFSWFKMFPILVGINDEPSPAGFLSEAQQHFDDKAMRPFMNKLQTKVSNELTVKGWDLSYVLDYEFQMTPENRVKLGGLAGALPGITVDQGLKMSGLPPHEDKEIGKTTLNMPQPEMDANGQGGGADRNLPGEKGRPPLAKNTKAFPKGGTTASQATLKKGGKSIEEILAELEVLETKAIETPADRVPVDLLAARRVPEVDLVVGSFEHDLATAARILERGLLDTTEGKALTDTSDILEKLRNSKAWAGFDTLAQEAYEKALLRVMSAAAIHHGEIGLRPAGEIDYQKLIDDLVGRKDSGIAAISKSFKDVISSAVKEARDEGEDIRGIQDAVQGAVLKWTRDSGSKIAITEATRGYNEATLDVAEQSGFTHVQVSDGLEDDEPCIDADGSTWTLEYARAHSLEHPRCRRAFIPIST